MSGGEALAEGPLKTGRVDAVDCARGLALVGMAAYHLTWDLADFRVVSPMLPFSPPMRLVSHVVGSAFLALVGVSLALAHRDRLNLPAFWRRLAIVAGAAALVTAASLVFAPGQAIWFGILHCIAAASLVALPFVEAPPWASVLAGATAIALPFFVHSTLFDPPALLWLGLGEALPNTLDWYPLLPWAGVVLIGLGFARLPGVLPRLTSPWRWRAKSYPARGVCFAGETQPRHLSRSPADPDRLGRGRRLIGPARDRPSAEAGLPVVSGGLRARLRRAWACGGGLRKRLPMRSPRGRALGRSRTSRRA